MKHYNYFLLSCLSLPSLLQAQPSERPKALQECMEVRTPSVELALWDSGVEDDDSIRLYLNGQVVLDSFRLSKTRQTITLQLNPGPNELTLYALNLGSIPNNTAAFSINGSGQKSLQSGLDVSGTMNLVFTAPGSGVFSKACPPEARKDKQDDKEAQAIRNNPAMALSSWRFMQEGLRWDASQPARKVELQDCYNSSTGEVELEFWDCGVEDNDTVSLMLNGTWILKEHRLTKAGNSIKVTLNRGENLLILYAHNLGDIPKNTAAIAIRNQHVRNEVGMMISDESTCGAIRISYGLTDENGVSIFPCLDENTIDSTSEPEIIYLNTQGTNQAPGVTTTPNNPPPVQPAPPVTRPGQPRPPVVVPAPTRPSPQPTPPSTTPAPPGGRQPGDNPGGGSRTRPKPAP